MIRYRRPPQPTDFDDSTLEARTTIEGRIDPSTGLVKRPLESHDFTNKWRSHKDAFNTAQYNKCAYCERKYTGDGDVEHILPKAKVTQLGNEGKELPTLKVQGRTVEAAVSPGYWWRAYDWSNYCFACNHCNRKWKRNHLEVDPRHTRTDPPHPTRQEVVLLVHPYEDAPQHHLRVDSYGVMSGRTNKGASTIRTLGLNRPSLIQHRWDAYRDAWNAALVWKRTGEGNDVLSSHLRPDRPFVLARWWALQDVLE